MNEQSNISLLETAQRKLFPNPLRSQEQFDALYAERLKSSHDKIAHIKMRFIGYFDGQFGKRFFIGHSGVGKTTELNKLALDTAFAERFVPLHLSAVEDLNPVSINGLNTIQCIVAEVAQQTSERIPEFTPDEKLLQSIQRAFQEEEIISKEIRQADIRVEAGAKVGASWPSVLKLFAQLRARMRASSESEIITKEKRERCLSEFLDPANLLLESCTYELKKKEKKEWLVIFDDFEKGQVPWTAIEDVFLNHGSLLRSLNVHLLIVAPLALACSTHGRQLPFECDYFPDTPVFQQDHSPHETGRKAMTSVITRRVPKDCFENEEVMQKVIVASGGNLRDCFELLTTAILNARCSEHSTITIDDVDAAITDLRVTYERRLGDNPHCQGEKITYDQKVEKLLSIYNGKTGSIPVDAVMHDLMAAGAVQEFNGTHWYGVHPMVVEILCHQGHLPQKAHCLQ